MRVEDVREVEAVALAVLVEWTFEVEGGVGAADAGAGVAKDIQIHKLFVTPIHGLLTF